MIINILITLSIVVLMEGITWFTHKYIMHGFLWILHKDHHDKKSKGFFEDNDLFFLIFAIPSIALFYFGSKGDVLDFRFFIGLGILIYGILYLLVHDIFIHQRFKIFSKSNSPYFKALRRAHKVHHKHIDKNDGECFGMLWVPLQYFREYNMIK
ncbi:MAG: sterol desaturase family protein [Cyclobacteriaceae bacterium]